MNGNSGSVMVANSSINSSSTGSLTSGNVGNNRSEESAHPLSPKIKRPKTEFSFNEDVEGAEMGSVSENYGFTQNSTNDNDSDNEFPATDNEGLLYSGQESPSKYKIIINQLIANK